MNARQRTALSSQMLTKQLRQEDHELLTLNGLVAKALGAHDIKLAHPRTVVAYGVPDFRLYDASWSDIERASHDLHIGYSVFDHAGQTKVRLTFDGPVAALALVFRVSDKSDDQPATIIPQLLRFYLRTRDWQWDNKAPIAGFDELFENWFGKTTSH